MPIALPVVRPFEKPYEAWTYRDATDDEISASMKAGEFTVRSMRVKDVLLARVTNESLAAEYMAMRGVDGVDNSLEFYIDRALAADPCFQSWLRAMPNVTPTALEDYQQEFPLDNYDQVDLAIRQHGAFLSTGQILFHGGDLGNWPSGHLVTARPLSATFCPQVALREAEWGGKAFEAGRVCLYLLRICSANAEAFVFDPKASNKGNEKEVLLASEARLVLRSARVVRDDYRVHRPEGMRTEAKTVPFYICEIDVF
jgi:hypothetical protein